MRIVHRISLSTSKEDRREFASFGIAVGEGFTTFEAEEGAPGWPALEKWIERRRPADVVATRFSPEELARSAWLRMLPSWHQGYPQPEDGYLEQTYDLSEYCPECGVGALQKDDFRMKAEPRWGRNGILQLNWVFDEYFARPEVWSEVLEPLRVGRRRVLSSKGKELRGVVQLVASAKVDVALGDDTRETCRACGRVRYAPWVREPFPPISDPGDAHLFKTRQDFGSGKSAHKEVVGSAEAFRKLQEGGVRGVSFYPVAPRP